MRPTRKRSTTTPRRDRLRKRHLRLHRRARRSCSDVNLRIDPGPDRRLRRRHRRGKSTLLSLVPRFYDPTAGRVLLDGHDLRDITKKSLRNQISIVLQDTLLFSTTIRENIAYGRPDATEEEIIEAAKRAQAHDFIIAHARRLPLARSANAAATSASASASASASPAPF